MVSLFWIGLGGFCGAIGRYRITEWTARRFAPDWPYGTLLVNVTGSGALGLLVGIGAADRWPTVFALVGIGALGAYTTFSTYAAESWRLLAERRFARWAAYQLVSYGGSLGAASIGWTFSRLWI